MTTPTGPTCPPPRPGPRRRSSSRREPGAARSTPTSSHRRARSSWPEHWSSSGFANTDLDLLLSQHRISRIVLIGMRANTCIDTTARFGQELGYHVTFVRDTIAAFSPEEMQATFELNAPTYAHAILTTDEFVKALPPNAS
ncbi:isochorismatase family protein [Streptomyces sp. NPDC001982]|uniref:isochorismatase family protein n=1 Tax=Streptomyces sp. NPDC001982 TaxID=3154405 RepID=UPI00331C3316